VYKDILQGAGVLDILLQVLSNTASLCDLTMIQVSAGQLAAQPAADQSAEHARATPPPAQTCAAAAGGLCSAAPPPAAVARGPCRAACLGDGGCVRVGRRC
jgi:hypothetical protein